MKKVSVILIIINIFIGNILFSDGNEAIDLFKSPDIFVTGGSYVLEQAPMTSMINPASNALEQRISLNLNYTALFGDENLKGYDGTGVNLGITIPLRAGNITTTGYYLVTKDIDELKTGDNGQGGCNLSFSKEVYEDFLFGIGINAFFGTGWGVTADLGVIKHQGNVSFMKNMKWGIVLGELGYSTFNKTESNAPSLFTPGAGIAFDLIDSKNVKFNIDSSINFPYCQNARFSLGGYFDLFDYAGVRFSSTADVKELINSDFSALIPTFGLYVNFKTNFKDKKMEENGFSNNDVRTSISASPLQNGLWGISGGINANLGVVDKDAPVIEMDFSKYKDEDTIEAISLPETDEKTSKDVSFKSKKDKKKRIYVSENKNKEKRDKEAILSINNLGNMERGPNGEDIITYISPNNDGIKDNMEIPLSITDSRYIKGYSFVIEDAKGNTVKVIENKEKRPENQGFFNFFERLFYIEKGVDIPKTIRWDGVGDDGKVVSDGFYSFYISAWDDNNNVSKTEKYGIVVDNTPPKAVLAEIKDESKIFSPNNDGNKDVIEFVQNGTEEDLWKVAITGADGEVYRNYDWKNQAPETFVWDGKNNNKGLVADGVYFYYISSTDRAGNTFEEEIPNIIINTQSTPVSLNVSSSFLSPGNSNAIDKIEFTLNVPIKTGIESWSLKIENEAGSCVKEYNSGEIKEKISYYGQEGSKFIEEGKYKAVLSIQYINGNNPSAESPEIVVDKTTPSASAKASLKIFSPNGDGKKDELTIYQDTSLEDEWYGRIEDENGKTIKEFKWVSNAASSFKWDGYTNDGNLAPDGRYKYRLLATDKAGNKGETETIEFSLDTEETPVMLTSSSEAFSPNGDNIKDSIILKPILNINAGISNYKIEIKNTLGEAVKTITSKGTLKKQYIWDGITDLGRRAPDGDYIANLEVVYEKGDVSRAVTRDFKLDTEFPEIKLELDFTLFSPDNDGKKDFINIYQNSSKENLFTAMIKNKAGISVRDYKWENKIENIRWNGTDYNGNKVEDGSYTYIVIAEDDAGNKTTKKIEDIIIDTRQTNVFVTYNSKGITPNGDGKNDYMEFTTITNIKDGIESWKFNILDEQNRLVKTYTDEFLPEKIIWDGCAESGEICEGTFTAEYRVVYKKGNEPCSITKSFAVDITSPQVFVQIDPVPFSPDNDGVDDELSIKLEVVDQNGIADWSFDIVDREKNDFAFFSGKGKPSEEIIWDGVGKNGELVLAAEDYAYRFAVSDEFGNSTSEYGLIPVDVLVVKDGNNLKIQIANITFAPDSAELRKDDPEIKKKNEYVLARLTEILKKYDKYKIMIEGHAVSVFWYDDIKAKQEETTELIPLSKARAETVKNYLSKLGINSSRMTTKGVGGQKPLVPHSDLVNRWKNRRVEFILIK